MFNRSDCKPNVEIEWASTLLYFPFGTGVYEYDRNKSPTFDKTVWVKVDNDYRLGLESRAEVDQLIESLISARDEAFPQ